MDNLLITGGASGIGKATAQRLASRMHVIIADRDEDRATQTAHEITQAGGTATAVTVDVGESAAIRKMMAWIADNVGPVHALFNNAGINRRAPVEQIIEDDWDLMMRTHVKAAYLCMQAVLPGMRERGRGLIVNTSSDYAVMGMRGAAAYAAAKTALYSLTKSLALEFAKDGIRINAIGPGPIDTPLLRSGRTAEEWDKQQSTLKQRIPMGRMGQPDEVAAVVDFLMSDRSSYITGQIIHPNGGQLSW